jgi:uncharacterized glyoxalase superfamily protein PhnB
LNSALRFLRVISKKAWTFTRTCLAWNLSAAVIEIYGAVDGETYDGPSPAALNLALRVENASAVDKLYERLSGLGADMIESPQDRPWGHRSFIMNDPDQIPIHIYCELK